MSARAALLLVVACLACTKPPEPCVRALQVTGNDPSGLEVCGKDVNRTDDVSCVAYAPTRPTCDPVAACDEGGGSCACRSDADCGANGFCESGDDGCSCYTPCRRDADCDDGEACLCSAFVSTSEEPGDLGVQIVDRPTCVAADCRKGDDCDSGTCGVSFTVICVHPEVLQCRDEEKDACGVEGKTCQSGEACTTDNGAPFRCIDARGACE